MPSPIYLLPDPVLALQQYLRLRAEVTALTVGTKIVTEIPTSPDYATPYVIIQWGGGSGIWPAFDEASLQVDVIGGTKFACGKLARTIRATVWAIANDIVPEGVIASGSEEMAPAWLPDTTPVPPLPRYVARYRILTHP